MSIVVDFNIMIDEMYKDTTPVYQIIGKALHSICKKFIFQLEEDIEKKIRYFHVQCHSDALQLLSERMNMLGLAEVSSFQIMPRTESSTPPFVMQDTPIDGPWTDSDFGENAEYIDQMGKVMTITYDTLYPFQKSLYDMSNSFDYRTIDMIYDPVGGNGKTLISNYLNDHNNCYTLPNCHDYHTILLDAYNHTISLRSQFGDGYDSRCRNIKAMIIDLSGDRDTLSQLIISAAETMKRGQLFDYRFSYKIHRIEPPRVFIFCKKLPELSILLKDYIKIWTIENKKLVRYTVSPAP